MAQLRGFLRHRTTVIWLLLVLATLVSWWAATHSSFHTHHLKLVGIFVLLIGFVKARYVGLDFMGLRSAPAPLRLLMQAWLVTVFSTIAVLFVLA